MAITTSFYRRPKATLLTIFDFAPHGLSREDGVAVLDRLLLGLLLTALLLFSGCSPKMPLLTPPSIEQENTAVSRLYQFLDRPRINALDADVRIRWDVLGSSGAIDALLQVEEPALLRLTVVDPLGRSMLILVSDGTRFTMADNREGRGYEGNVDSAFIRTYIPPEILSNGLFAMLGGMIRPDGDVFKGVGIDTQQKTWYRFADNGDGEYSYRVFLGNEQLLMKRRVLVNENNEIVLDLQYGEYRAVDALGSLWPERVTATGSLVRGTLEMEVKEVVAVTPMPPSQFRLSLPPHYVKEEVD